MYKPIQNLPDEKFGKLMKAIFEYQIDGKEIELPDDLKMAFLFFKNQFDVDNEKYKEICERNKQNIQKRWNNTKNTSGKNSKQENTKNTKNTDNDTDIDIDNEKDNDNVNENNNSPPQKFEEEKIKKIDNNSNLKNEYIMKMRDAETR